ncbi:MAG: alpha,alpha-trehalase TreF [Saprospiraceae bacterium]|nr:alpha,alpha-trehalase TreF [Saprospiraceae bacterium]
MITRYTLLIFMLAATFWSCRQSNDKQATDLVTIEKKQHLPPDERYGQLFTEVQMAEVFPDGKTFVDCIPKYPTSVIMAKYEQQKSEAGFDLEAFVMKHFDLPKQYSSDFETNMDRTPSEHINALWPVLTREPDAENTGTLIPLPKPYVVPGGRFGEIYYWDSYFTMLGLEESGKVDMIENMVDNFSFLIDSLGFIPNGNRTYFDSRSQPPFYAAMINLLAAQKDEATVLKKYLPYLELEYAFWMNGADRVTEVGATFEHCVRVDENTILARYWDRKATPRQEMHHDDMMTAKKTDRPNNRLFRDIRAACESGWDFSSRWLTDPMDLATIHTTDIIPVDLNALLYNLENTLAKAYAADGQEAMAAEMEAKSAARSAAIEKYCWSDEDGYYMDYDFVKGSHTDVPSLAGMFPLFFEIADPAHVPSIAQNIENKFLKPGGLVSTVNNSGQQWDAPNGWAPLQWISIQGLRNYEQNELAETIKNRWVDLNVKVYKNTGKMVEKYNVQDMTLEAGGGEYPVQDGFGWTNGVLLKLLSED